MGEVVNFWVQATNYIGFGKITGICTNVIY